MNLHEISGGIVLRLEETPLALDRAGIFASFSAGASLCPTLEAASVPSRKVEPVILTLDRSVDEREVTFWELFNSILANLPLRGQFRTPTPFPLSTFRYASHQRYPKMTARSCCLEIQRGVQSRGFRQIWKASCKSVTLVTFVAKRLPWKSY